MGNVQAVTKFRQKRKHNLIQLMGGKCCLCGYNKTEQALEFHHINPENKKFQISSGNCHNIQEDISEVEKCILVCANCHREIHANLYKNIDFFKYQHISLQIKEKLLHKEKKELVCKNCGNPITIYSKSGLCVHCAQSARYRHRIDNKPNREELKNLIRTKTFVEIGELYGVSDNAIRKWCDKMSLPRTKKAISTYSDVQWAKI